MADEKLRNGQEQETKKAVSADAKNPVKPGGDEEKASVSETWAQETIEDLDDFIESQGIYIRQ